LQLIDLGIVETPPGASTPLSGSIISPEADSLLEIGVTQILLTQIEDEETDFVLLMNLHGKLTSVVSQETVWTNDQIVYVSAPAELIVWTEPGTDYLENEIAYGLNELSEEIWEQLFGSGE
jgi:hypothetical protein